MMQGVVLEAGTHVCEWRVSRLMCAQNAVLSQ